METLDYWTPADALAFRCSVEQVGQLRPAEPVPVVAGERPDVTEARLYAARAMRALARVAEGDNPKAAVEAAKAILDRAYGPPVVPLPPVPVGAPPEAEPFPDYITQQRLSCAYMPDVDVPQVSIAHADK